MFLCVYVSRVFIHFKFPFVDQMQFCLFIKRKRSFFVFFEVSTGVMEVGSSRVTKRVLKEWGFSCNFCKLCYKLVSVYLV